MTVENVVATLMKKLTKFTTAVGTLMHVPLTCSSYVTVRLN